MVGQKFGAWTVVKQLSNGNGTPSKQYICRCDCGKLQQKFHHEIIKKKSLSCHNCCKKEQNKSLYKTKEEKTANLLRIFGGKMDEMYYKSENTTKSLSLEERYNLFLHDIEQLNDPFLISLFKNYKSLNETLTLQLPSDFKFFEDLIKTTESQWKPLYNKHFNNALITIGYNGKDQ